MVAEDNWGQDIFVPALGVTKTAFDDTPKHELEAHKTIVCKYLQELYDNIKNTVICWIA